MPYTIASNHPKCESNEVALLNQGEFVACHPNEQSARDQIAAIEANKNTPMDFLENNHVVSPQVNEIKDLDDKGTFGGPLVVFSGPDSPDLEQDFFNKDTEFFLDLFGKSAAFYQHGTDPKLGKTRIDVDGGKLKKKEEHIWYETQLQKRNEYEEMIQELAKKGKLGLSSGTASHLVQREQVESKGNKTVHWIKQWPLGFDSTLTPTPAEPRTNITPVKNIQFDSLTEIAAKVLNGRDISEEEAKKDMKAMSIYDKLRMIRSDFKDRFSNLDDLRVSTRDIYSEFIIARNKNGKYYRIEYGGNLQDGFSFQDRSEWTEVVKDEQFVARSLEREMSKELDELNNLIEGSSLNKTHRDGGSTSEKDVAQIIDEMNQLLDSHA
jgi:hypothetical protein